MKISLASPSLRHLASLLASFLLSKYHFGHFGPWHFSQAWEPQLPNFPCYNRAIGAWLLLVGRAATGKFCCVPLESFAWFVVPFYPAATSCGFCFQSVEMPKARKVGPPQQFQKEMVFATHFLQVVSSGDHYLVDDFFFNQTTCCFLQF